MEYENVTRLASDSQNRGQQMMPPKKKSFPTWAIVAIIAVIALPILLVVIGLVAFVASDSFYSNSRSSRHSQRQPAAIEQIIDQETNSRGVGYDEPDYDEPVYDEPVETAADPDYYHLNMYGTLGGANDAWLVCEYGYEGTVTFTVNGTQNTRKVTFNSYDETTGTLVLNEYFTNGNYIGHFDGVFRNGTYKGVFTNENSGGQIEFCLYNQ